MGVFKTMSLSPKPPPRAPDMIPEQGVEKQSSESASALAAIHDHAVKHPMAHKLFQSPLQRAALSQQSPPTLTPLPSRPISFPPPTLHLHSSLRFQHHHKPFVFISTFKWELRKGWDRLVEAYLAEFSSQDNVELYILTKAFMAGR